MKLFVAISPPFHLRKRVLRVLGPSSPLFKQKITAPPIPQSSSFHSPTPRFSTPIELLSDNPLGWPLPPPLLSQMNKFPSDTAAWFFYRALPISLRRFANPPFSRVPLPVVSFPHTYPSDGPSAISALMTFCVIQREVSSQDVGFCFEASTLQRLADFNS